MKIGIIGKRGKKEVYKIAGDLIKWLDEKGVEFYVDKELGKNIGIDKSLKQSELPKNVDLVVVFGGDGTFLNVSQQVNKYNIPILGFNLGGLGFLTEFTVNEIYPIMEMIISGDYEIEEREMISATIFKKGKKSGEYKVLNDLVINNGEISRIIDLAIFIDGDRVTTFKADGIIFSTPTGSTAYSLSAGGPIAYPTLPVILITPICPHILTNRPLVVSNEMEIKVKVLTGDQSSYLTLDGQETITLNLN
ncbi:MAG: NAD(+)/NADH kinase, partial [Thermodesulfobacteriota bacterium]